MSASVHFLLGRANTGKSAYITERMRAHQRAGERAVLIVPEQSTFEAERALSSALGGLFGVQVLSFERLSERVLALHGRTRPFLTQQGYRMVIRRAAMRHENELRAFSRACTQSGFAAEMQSIFSDCKRACLTPQALAALAEKLPDGMALCDKLHDIALLFADVEEYLAERYLTTDDAFNAALELLPHSFLQGVPVYIDGVDRPDRQLYRLLEGILRTAGSLTVALCCDLSSPRDADVFLPGAQVFARIRALAEQAGARVTVETPGAEANRRDPALRYLEQNLFAYPAKPCPEHTDAVTVFGASGRFAEAEALADAIQSRARAGVRYREMAVIVSDLPGYAPLVQRVFARHGIPVFLDQKRPVTSHAAVDAALSAVRAVAGGYAAHDVLRLVKTGYAGVSPDDGEALELYLLRTGLRGTALTRPFSRGEVPEAAERARAAVMEPLVGLQAGLNGRGVSEKVRALYAYLMQIDLDGQLGAQAEKLLSEGRIGRMEEHAQVWSVLMTLLSQLDAIMGELPVSRETFLKLLEEGLNGCSIGVIPGTSDQVLLGDVARTKVRGVRALFVAGVNDGLLPLVRNDDGLIDDAELDQMEKLGASVWSRSAEREAGDRLDLYTAFSKARETLFVSYALSSDGADLSPSSLITRILRLLPNCRRETDIVPDDALPTCERAGMTMLTSDLRAFHADGTCGARLPSLLAYYEQRPDYAARVRRMLAAGRVRFALPSLPKDMARALYGGRITMSASRLEQFNACPFKHFVRYGLRAADRSEYTEKATDLGAFYHAALDAFVERVRAEGREWKRLDETEVDAVMDAVLPEVIQNHNGGIFLHHERLRATLFLLVDTVKMSARAVARQIRAGDFTPLGAEVRFGEGEAFPPVRLTLPSGGSALVSGIIDRVDGAKVGESEYLRVVDYKSSERELDYAGILHGLTLQLPLYLAAVTQRGKAAGMYYMPLRAPAPAEDEDPAAAAESAFRLRGLTLNDATVLLASDGAADGASGVIKGLKTRDGEAYQGELCSKEEFSRLLDAARAVSERTLSDMLEGKIAISPAERACAYCDYRSVCRFDPMAPGCRTRKYRKLKMDEFLTLIGGDADAMDE